MTGTKPRSHIRVALAVPEAQAAWQSPEQPSAGAIYHGFAEPEMTMDEYLAATAKARAATCSSCPKEITVSADTLSEGQRFFCSKQCHEHGIAMMNHIRPKGETYNVNGVEYDI